MVPGMYPYITARTAHFDGLFQEALSEGFGQIVILGAGYDTRALRFESGKVRTTVFELDAPATRQYKRQCLAKAGMDAPDGVRSASVDLKETDWPSTLETLGHRPSEPTVFFMEGLLMYLDADTIDGILASIRQSAAAGSRIVFDATARSVVDGTGDQYGAKGVMARASDHGETFLSGIEPEEMPEFLRAKGFTVRTHLLSEDLEKRFLGDFDPSLIGPISGCFTNVVAEVS
ncbi:MAG: class I SAM-dependent methyltransferase [Desulfobacterales bacterium]|nr:class I SAM-dependent methyltransferase [Desulfobacterales bacterium]